MPVTRCPECATAFRVTEEQLQARAGQVRCGHCGEVFDAVAALEPDHEPPATPAERAPAPSADPRAAAAPEADITLSRPAPLEEDWMPIEPEPPRRGRAAWAALAALLLVVLIGQIAFYFRGTIAILWPQSKPFLTTACARVGCDVPLPRKADLVTIETSDLRLPSRRLSRRSSSRSRTSATSRSRAGCSSRRITCGTSATKASRLRRSSR
jgi:predicted Zn finger-like uncharacterized protein